MLQEEIGRTATRINQAQLGSSIVAGCNLVILKSKAPTTSGMKGAASRVLINGVTNGVNFPKMLKEHLEALVGDTLDKLIDGLPKLHGKRCGRPGRHPEGHGMHSYDLRDLRDRLVLHLRAGHGK